MTLPLARRRIWVTRPAGQADALCAALAAQGAEPVRLPLLQIAPAADAAPLQAALDALAGFDLAVFVSPSALDAVAAARTAPWPAGVPAAVVGPGSAARARALGIAPVIAPPAHFDSAGLLAELDTHGSWAGRRAVLFRGDGGRPDLPDGLRARGLDLTVVAAYRRLPATLTIQALDDALAAGCDAVIISSSEAAQHLFALAGEATREQLQSLVYFAPHPRIIAALAEHDVDARLSRAGDAGIVDSLCCHFARPTSSP
ncbi:uroporphyrinogen-III synthase [Chitiniphilus purpureus]|uniref:Uroporphyrinogen-III synthase n=1 Tax=Chitiniphilus purpureus TaxID=2981137 RepID=A0ABY6DNE6_9NEIS|nr:uroporphyrinogen-III synthase [Chitiniphilus sp. CD1]UXY15871.1 uroporphyrinogen-III synthase [Chitiniphilus sp. CD1]